MVAEKGERGRDGRESGHGYVPGTPAIDGEIPMHLNSTMFYLPMLMKIIDVKEKKQNPRSDAIPP